MTDTQDSPSAPSAAASRLRISEIFLSLQGESLTQGLPTLFIRLTGCPLRCHYCDTDYAFSGGHWMYIPSILQQATAQGVHLVTVTGGEPLAQSACPELLTALCDAGFEVAVETSGAMDISSTDPRVVRVMDIKTPGSGEAERNHYANIQQLTPQDQLKFVISNEADYHWARELIREKGLLQRCPVLMLPVHQQLAPTQLADWIIRDRLAVRLQIQLHKLLWQEQRGR